MPKLNRNAIYYIALPISFSKRRTKSVKNITTWYVSFCLVPSPVLDTGSNFRFEAPAALGLGSHMPVRVSNMVGIELGFVITPGFANTTVNDEQTNMYSLGT